MARVNLLRRSRVARLSLAKIHLSKFGGNFGTLELAGSEVLSHDDMAATISEIMSSHYDANGFQSNAVVLESILGRLANSYRSCVKPIAAEIGTGASESLFCYHRIRSPTSTHMRISLQSLAP